MHNDRYWVYVNKCLQIITSVLFMLHSASQLLWNRGCSAAISQQNEFLGIIYCVRLPWVVLLHPRRENTKYHLQDKRNLSEAAFIESLQLVCERLWIAAAELIYRWALLHLIVQRELRSLEVWKAILFCNMEEHVYLLFPLLYDLKVV